MRFAAWMVLAATLLLWAGNWIVARAVRDEIAPAFATVLRQLIVLAVLLPFVRATLFSKLRQLNRREWLLLAGLGLAGGGVHLGFQWLGMHFTTAASGMLFLSTSPIFTLLLAIPLGEQVSRRQWLGVAISFAGILVIATQGEVQRLSFNIGDLLVCLSMAMWAAYTVLLGIRCGGLSVLELLTMTCAFGFVFIQPWLAWEYATGRIFLPGTAGVLAVIYSAFGSLFLAHAGWSYAVRRLGAGRTGATMHLIPAFGIPLSALLLHEYPVWYHFVGIALILSGVALSTLGRRRA
ncbi:MAG TPA: DMT family transporter [Burkholderiales bacterium]|nr:DMT family transporter [Burkholderiales bacterium]